MYSQSENINIYNIQEEDGKWNNLEMEMKWNGIINKLEIILEMLTLKQKNHKYQRGIRERIPKVKNSVKTPKQSRWIIMTSAHSKQLTYNRASRSYLV